VTDAGGLPECRSESAECLSDNNAWRMMMTHADEEKPEVGPKAAARRLRLILHCRCTG
jgi:hypothetical protein